jgi:hypothetical protein
MVGSSRLSWVVVKGSIEAPWNQPEADSRNRTAGTFLTATSRSLTF